ncbi:tripartite tricarboxylate transporter substrate binding protein [Roseomonas terrae]|jgi:tripartite-type tricarboxylate transporter receptor subunit TctC|uniref:Tripartite tricarboxylate transporter substrate binding protein n=1 Tax=Neoroseomonas terrae TaxID=424799 RepID=A0ABS5EBC6_9PROT|nr:tripartite tricarboxylate transporter substrate binding protein [Neoroseomonas terrae]MBR0648325.1 tripartite tricarboxylate transporter substrate binding protein [Neoroseomonas terrae]
MFRRLLLSLPAALAAPRLATAQGAYPDRPITILLGLAPGGSGDATMRHIARAASEELGVPVVVENRPGGAQTIATTRAARSRPDGYTLLQTTIAPFGTVPASQPVQYNIETDFTYLGQYTTILHPNYVLTGSPFQNWQQVIDYAKANPGKLRWAAATPLSGPHIANAAAFQHLGLETIFVPFNGGSEAVTALLGGHIDLVVSSDYAPLLAAGQVRLLSEIGADRAPGMEAIPCYGELGYPLPLRSAFGLAGPANLPPAVVEAWSRVLRKIDASPEWKALLQRYMALPSLKLGDEFRTDVITTYQRLGRIVPSLRIER